MNFKMISVWGTVLNSWLTSPVKRGTPCPPSLDFKAIAWEFHKGDILPDRITLANAK